MKSIRRHVQIAYDELLLISKTVDHKKTLEQLQSLIRENQSIQDFLAASAAEKISQISDQDFEAIQLSKEILKFLNSNSISNLPQHFDCLLVPFERALQKRLADPDFLITTTDNHRARTTYPVRLVLENLRSDFNVGSIFRSAECMGSERIELCGYTPVPQKTDMGTKSMVPFQKRTTHESLIEAKKDGFLIIALETSPQSKSLWNAELTEKTCFVLGNERHGILPETLKLCDEVIQIPLLGNKNSLNVGVTASLALYEYVRRKK